jgi:uncharacterized Zn finger protein
MTPCRVCGSNEFQIHKVFTTYRDNVFLVLCGECKTHGETLAMVVPCFESLAEVNSRAEKLWNEANAK